MPNFLLYPFLNNNSSYNFGNRFRFSTLDAEPLYFNYYYYSTVDTAQTKSYCFGIQQAIFKKKKKGKSVPLQARGAQRVPGS